MCRPSRFAGLASVREASELAAANGGGAIVSTASPGGAPPALMGSGGILARYKVQGTLALGSEVYFNVRAQLITHFNIGGPSMNLDLVESAANGGTQLSG